VKKQDSVEMQGHLANKGIVVQLLTALRYISPEHLDKDLRLLQFSEYWQQFSWEKSDWGMKQTPHFHLVPC
jgi:hypothetical protein